jgi:acyl-CoA thioesterase
VSTPFFTRQMEAVRPHPSAPGRYCVEIDAGWNCPLIPHGGLVTALAARAMGLELDHPEHRLRSVSVVFADQVTPGPAEIDVTVLRQGRSMSQATATIQSDGRDAGHTSIAVFGGERPGFEFTDLPVPSFAPEPDDCPSFRDPWPEDFAEQRTFEFPFWDHIEGRPISGHAPWEEYVPETSEIESWHRFDEVPRRDDGTLDPLALVTLCDTMPGSVDERMGNDVPPWLPPSADLTVHLFGEATSEWILSRKHARHAGSGYASLDIELWDPDARALVAYGTQVMYLRFLEGPPTEAQRRPPT